MNTQCSNCHFGHRPAHWNRLVHHALSLFFWLCVVCLVFWFALSPDPFGWPL
jgi:hypothetical protein